MQKAPAPFMSESPAISDDLCVSSRFLERVKNGLESFTKMLAPTANGNAMDAPMGEPAISK